MPDSTVLIVDDDPEILSFYAKIFGARDDSLDVFANAEPAAEPALKCLTFLDPHALLAHCAAQRAAGVRHPLCIIDMRMPSLNGLATALRVREIDPGIDIIICSAFSDVSMDEIGSRLKSGIFFVRKPFVVGEFTLLVRSLAGYWRSRRDLEQVRSSLDSECAKLAEILEATRVGTWNWSIPDGALALDERWAEIAGYTLAELAPLSVETWQRLCHPEDLERSNAALRRVFAREIPFYDCECRLLHKSGEWIWVRARGKVSAWLPDGRPARMFGTHADITGRKREQAELLEAKHLAEEASRAKSLFLAIMSHEIRTPLNGIIGAIEMLAASGLSDKQKEFVEMTLASSEALLSTINDVLDYSKIESSHIEVERVGFSVKALLQEIIDILSPFARKKGLSLTATPAPGLPATVCGDPTRLRQVLTNLAANGLKFTNEGSVEVTAAPAAGDAIRFSVSDTGPGIAPENFQRLFEPFTQADVSTTRQYGGTGLGLAIAKSLVEIQGGTLGVESRPGHGTRFSFEVPLPAFSGPVGSHATAPETPAPPGAPLDITLLMVEDNPTNQRVTSFMLRSLGISRFSIACNGREAIQQIARTPVEFILMDFHMPEMDGCEATREIRRLEAAGAFARRHTIIGLSAAAVRGDRESALAAGMDDYLTKPVRKKVLEECLRSWVAKLAPARAQ